MNDCQTFCRKCADCQDFMRRVDQYLTPYRTGTVRSAHR